MLETVDKERMTYICNSIVENEKITENNAKYWTFFLDNQLREFVVLYNFNFFEVANRFHGFISIENRYEFNENEIRRHWSFLHAMRYLNKSVDNDYYIMLKNKYKIEEEIKEKKIFEEENKNREEERERRRREEEEENRRNQENIQKVKYERFNMITIDMNFQKDGKVENEIVKVDDGKQVKESNGVIDEKTKQIYDIPESTHKNKEENINDQQFKKDTVQDSINDSKNFQNPEDFFESDEFINDIFKNQKKLINKIKEDENKFNKDSEEFIESYEANLFPINTSSNPNKENKPIHSNENNVILNSTHLNGPEIIDFTNKITDKYEFEGIEKDLENTISIDDIIKDNNNLKEQYENLNTYYNFAVKSLNYFIPKLGKGLNDKNNTEEENYKNEENNFEDDVIKKTSFKINQLLMDSVKEASNKHGTIEEFKKKIDEEEALSNNIRIIPPDTNSDFIKSIDAPNENDQEHKISMFKAYMFSEAQKITTPDLLGKIVEIINNTYLDEVKLKNEKEYEQLPDEELNNSKEEETLNETKNTQNEKEIHKNPPNKNVIYYKGVAYYTDKPVTQLNDSDDSYMEDD